MKHLNGCAALEPMWHKGPCDCGMELLPDLFEQVRRHVTPHSAPSGLHALRKIASVLGVEVR